MAHAFQGIYPALLTPFDKNGKVNHKVLRDLVEYNIQKGVAGFYVNGSTAEVFLLSDEERRSIYETVAEAAQGRVKLLAHIGAISTEQTIRYGKLAKELGYDAISAVSPFYYKFSFDQIKAHYFSVVNAVDMPMIIYNFPNFSGVNLSVAQVAQFFCDDRFIGIKHTSNDFFALERFHTNFPTKVVFNGFDEMFLAGISMGADGGIGSTYNFMAEKYIKIMALHKEGKMTEAFAIQQECNRILDILVRPNVGIMEGEKEIMTQMGFDFGPARSPFATLSDDVKAMIRTEIVDRL